MPKPLSVEEQAEIDARYVPFPSFDDWPNEVPESALWEQARIAFQLAAKDATEDDLKSALEIAQRAAAFDTGAIEGLYPTSRGLTITVATQMAMWEQRVEEQGPDALALFEAQLKAFEHVLDHATTSYPKITQTWIRRLHEELTAPQTTYVVQTPVGPQNQPLPKGRYKEYPNHVRVADGGIHAYAPVDMTQAEMDRLITELDSDMFQEAHPILQASYAHYALVAIHPFADGNGRVARAVASVYTYRDASIPLLVLDEYRERYFVALSRADTGEHKAFVTFIARVASEALDLARDSLQTAQAPQPKALFKRFSKLYAAEEEEKRRDQAARTFADWFVNAIDEWIKKMDVPPNISFDLHIHGDQWDDPPVDFKPISIDGARSFGLNFRLVKPRNKAIRLSGDFFLSKESRKPSAVLVRIVELSNDQLVIPHTDLDPTLSGLGQYKVENFLQRLFGNGLELLLNSVKE